MRGGERTLEAFCEIFPKADLFTLLHVPGSVTSLIEDRHIVTSFIQRLPGAATRYRSYLPLFPAAVRRFDLSGYELIISLSHCAAKAVRRPSRAVHISYCFSPMRYIWDLYDDYFGRSAPPLRRWMMPPVAAVLRAWDRRTDNVDAFVAISQHIADRIRRVYGRDADVIYPPVDVRRFRPAPSIDDFYLVVSALVPYKRVDLAIGAARRLRRRLIVVGTGPEERRLRAQAPDTVEFLGWRPDAEVAELYARCRAVLFPVVEDYGIVPLEAAAAGRPSIALARGGALETMVDLDSRSAAPTAVLFHEQSEKALADAILTFEAAADRFDPAALRARALMFDRPVFLARIREYVARQFPELERRRAC